MKRTIWVGRCADRKRPYCYSETKPRANDKGQYVMSDSGWSYMTEDFFGTDIPLWGLAKVTIDTETQSYWIEKNYKHGWYPVTRKTTGSNRILYWDGNTFADTRNDQCAVHWDKSAFSWIADEPIPDPFEKVEQ